MQRAAARISRSTSPRHRLSALLACFDIPMSSQLFDTLASRFSSPKINIEIPVERNLQVESLRVRILRFFSDDSRTKRCTYALSLSLSLFSFLSLFFVSRVSGLRHTQLCRALFLTLLRHDGAQTTTLIGAAQCVCAPRERHNVSNPRPNRESD